MIPSLCWVPRGAAAEEPYVLKLDPEELKELIGQAENNLEEEDDDDDPEGLEGDEDCEDDIKDEDIKEEDMADLEESVEQVKIKEGADEDEFNLEDYDNEGDGQIMLGVAGATYYANPEDDPYITLPDEDDEGHEVTPDDNLLCCAKLDGEMSSLEIHLWNEAEQDFYVHHDILLDKYPLCVEWLSYDAGEQEAADGSLPPAGAREPGNYVALGCMSPSIEIWDLDIINTSEPVTTLGKRTKRTNKKPKIGTRGHSDAVLALSWNCHQPNILASGSADHCILLWDLEIRSAKEILQHHTDKVQTLSWHPIESTTLLSGGFDASCHLVDCRTKSGRTWTLDGEIEQVCWNPSSPFTFLAGTSVGSVVCVDIRNTEPLYTLSAHDNEVAGLAITPSIPGLLATCSADKTVKVWNLSDNKPNCVTSRAYNEAMSLHCISFCPDCPTQLAIGALQGGVELWDLSDNRDFREAFNYTGPPVTTGPPTATEGG